MGAKGSRARRSTEDSLGDKVMVCDPYFRKLLVKNRGLLNIKLKVPIYDSYSLSLVYTPGVGESCLRIRDDINNAYIYTNLGNSMAVVTDGSDYKNSNDPKWNNDACIPQLEAQCLFYKVHSNIDAYPFIIDPKMTKTDEEFIECLAALQGTFSAIELYNIEESRLNSLIPKIQERNLKLAILTSNERSYIQDFIEKQKLQRDFPDGYITASILRAALDCRYRGFIQRELIDDLFNFLIDQQKESNLQFYHQWGTSIVLHKQAVKYFFAEKLENCPQTEQQIVSRFDNYMLQGKNAWIVHTNMEQVKPQSLQQNSLELHKRFQGMVKTSSKVKPKSIHKFYDIVRECCYEGLEDEIMANPPIVQELTFKANWCAIITNGTAILGFGDIGATAGLPVMEGKSCIFKQLGGVDVVPICIQEKDPKKLIDIIMRLSPIFSAINLEDIKAPECFEIENTLQERLDIPVFHDDQHGTAIVVASAVINSLKLMGKKASEVKLIVNGGGAAGLSITQLLLDIGVVNIIICDTKGAIYRGRTNNMNAQKVQLSQLTNPNNVQGKLEEVIEGADIFIGVSAAGALKPEWAVKMTKKNLILAMANPIPEIMPEEAKKIGAFIIGTGRSDFKNQTNNSLAFPGIFRGALDVRAKNITQEMKLAAAYAIANLIPDYELSPDYIIPSSLDTRVPIAVSKAVGMKAIEQGIARNILTEEQLEQNIRNFIVERNLLSLNSKL